MAKGNSQKTANGSALDFEAQLWAAADKMRGHMDASEYNGARPEGLCLGLIFLKYISDAFEEKREQLLFGFSDPKSEWFIKDEPQRADAAENDTLRSREREKVAEGRMRVVGEKQFNAARVWVRCRNFGMNRRGDQSILGQRWPCASTTTWKLARMNPAIRRVGANLSANLHKKISIIVGACSFNDAC